MNKTRPTPAPTPATTAYTLPDLPTGEHYAALIETSLTYDDGYGDHHSPSTSTARYLEYVVLGDQAAAMQWVKEREDSREGFAYGQMKPYRIIKVNPITVKKTVTLELK